MIFFDKLDKFLDGFYHLQFLKQCIFNIASAISSFIVWHCNFVNVKNKEISKLSILL